MPVPGPTPDDFVIRVPRPSMTGGLLGGLEARGFWLALGALLALWWTGHVLPTPRPSPKPEPPAPAPKPEPPKPDWLGLSPALPTVSNSLEWRPLPAAPGWEGYGKDVDGRFLIETWRRVP